MSAEVIESYLVSLGFETDDSSLTKFQGTLATAERFVSSSVGGIVGDFLKFQLGVTSAFIAAGFGVIGFTEKLAMSDQQMRLFAMRSFMTLEQARSVQTALGTLGASLEDVAWDKELHQRFTTLIADQRELSALLGPQYEQQMKDVRDVWFQLQRLEVKGQYFGMEFIGDLLKKLGFGDGTVLTSLEHLNDFVLHNMPKWADELSTDVVPILRDFWMLLKDIGAIGGDVAVIFTNLVGVLSGDSSIEGATFNFHNFASAVEKVAHFLAEVVHYMMLAERLFVAASPLGVLSSIAGDGHPLNHIDSILHGGSPAPSPQASGSTADQARQMAKVVSANTGIPADLIFGQWAHETGGFTNRGTRDLNNLAGIRYAGSTEYRKFDSLQDFASFYTHLIESKRYTSQGINAAHTPEEIARALKAGSYYEGDEGAYARGIRSWSRSFNPGAGAGSQISVGTINIPITHPGATPPDIEHAVRKGVKAGIDAHNQDNMTQLNGGYA